MGLSVIAANCSHWFRRCLQVLCYYGSGMSYLPSLWVYHIITPSGRYQRVSMSVSVLANSTVRSYSKKPQVWKTSSSFFSRAMWNVLCLFPLLGSLQSVFSHMALSIGMIRLKPPPLNIKSGWSSRLWASWMRWITLWHFSEGSFNCITTSTYIWPSGPMISLFLSPKAPDLGEGEGLHSGAGGLDVVSPGVSHLVSFGDKWEHQKEITVLHISTTAT